MLEARGNEGGDRQYDGNHLVGDRSACIGKPDRRADQHVAKNALEEQRHEIGADLSDGCVQYRQSDAAIVHVKMMGKENQDD